MVRQWFGLLVVGALCACGFPQPERVHQGDGGVDGEPLAPGKLASFGFTTGKNNSLVHDLNGAFSPDRSMIHSIGFQLDRSSMIPTFTTSDPHDVVEVGNEPQSSGTDVHDFTTPVMYQVTSVTGVVTMYSVTVESRDFSSPSNVVQGLVKDLVVGDVNGDGKPDIVLASSDLVVYLNTTVAGSTIPQFVMQPAIPSGVNPSRVVLADLNGDGKPEIISASDSSAGLSILVNATAQPGQLVFSAPQLQTDFGNAVQAIAAGDLNGDGRLDLATSDSNQNLVYERLNMTAVGAPMIVFLASSNIASGSLPTDIALATFDNDNILDTLVADQSQDQVQVIFGATRSTDQTPQFGGSRSTPVSAPYRLAITDIDHDGDPDVIVTTKSKSLVEVLTNDRGSMTDASYATTNPTVAVAVLDLDGDGYMDFVVASQGGGGGAVEPFINLADGTFHIQTSVSLPSAPIAAAVGDFNDDGMDDFVIANASGFSIYLTSSR